jgi:isoleucyl-tRNA synthetase
MFSPKSRQYMQQPDAFELEVVEQWESQDLPAQIIEARADAEPFVFFEGPPTANGRPGIHHVLARTLKDSMCRFQTMQGKRVMRKAGWDTHGLPVELEVEKQLGISGKPDIEKHGLGPFNKLCRESVFTYKKEWEELSQRIGYELDYDNPYVTFDNDYVESVWFLLSRFAANDLLYLGSKVLPWCGRCGTGLSSHEVGQGYKDIDDPSVFISFPLIDAPGELENAELTAWTTTPWTLPSNMAVCVHPDFEYSIIKSDERRFVMLEGKADAVFGEDNWTAVGSVKGEALKGLSYEPLFTYEGGIVINEGEKRHIVVADTFVSDDDGTGMVHMAPYGADDFRIAQSNDILAVLAVGEDARFVTDVATVSAGTFFRDANKDLSRDLKERERMLKVTQCNHSYPHCWRCDTPLIYFPAPAWFLRTTAYKDKMIEQNKQIKWAPPEIGAGRFGEWLENNIDWALSRDRFWGTPLPVWINEDDEEDWICVESFAQLGELCGGLPDDFDPHRPMVDDITFQTPTAGKSGLMRRVPQVIDCWFDSGAMPLAQHHWPFENRELVAEQFPADFICEGLDQTRGWFYSLHSISTFLTQHDEKLWQPGELWGEKLPRLESGSAYKSCLVNGLLLDKSGQKMSKRLGNIVVPGAAIEEHGADAIRWSLLSGGAAHLSRRYDDGAVSDVRRRVLGTLGASYDFFALYAKSEGFDASTDFPELSSRPAIDRWVLSQVSAAAEQASKSFAEMQPSNALRAIEDFIVDDLSNWYIRRSRRRFWGDEGEASQQAAFATLYQSLHAVLRMIAPVTPFFADAIWCELVGGESVHLQMYPDSSNTNDVAIAGANDADLSAAMNPIMRASSLGRSVRERVQIRVRQPLASMVVHIAKENELAMSPREYSDALRQELNVKEVQWIDGTPDFLTVSAKANFKTLGRKAGKNMKTLAAVISDMPREQIFALQGGDEVTVEAGGENYVLCNEDITLQTESAEGLEAATDGYVTIGLNTEISAELRAEGIAREITNRLQTQRKEIGLEMSDRIEVKLCASEAVQQVLAVHANGIAEEVLAPSGIFFSADSLDSSDSAYRKWDLPDDLSIEVIICKIDVATAS